ncbi:MAG: DUF4279 domain-containing protein [Chlorobi bacterium]|nr:DUF4279 domain-containing protein [Chlorobiota bacterium]MBX7215651.1 DUF4279 domain-containing protein [Candidatus Kapabacteria bacterium]
MPNKNITRKETHWGYTDGFVETLFVDEVCDLFMQRFNSRIEDIVQYINDNCLETQIDVVVEVEDNQAPSLSMSKDLISLMAKMNGSIDIDLYIY